MGANQHTKHRTSLFALASFDDLIVNVGKRLREERLSRGLSMRALAKLAGVSLHSVRNCERMISAPHLATVCSLCLALDLGWHDLLGEPEDHRSSPDEDHGSRYGDRMDRAANLPKDCHSGTKGEAFFQDKAKTRQHTTTEPRSFDLDA